MAERVVDDLETIEIEKQGGEFRSPGVVRCRASAQLIERRAEHAPVRKAGQRIFRRQPSHVGLRLGPQDLLHGRQDQQGQHYSGDHMDLQIGPGALEYVAVVDADADPQRMAPDLANGDQSTFAAGAFVVLEGGLALGLHVPRELRAAEILTQLVALEVVAAAGTDHAVAADHGDRAGRSQIDLVVKYRKVHGIEGGDHDAADAAVFVQEAPRELHRPLAAGTADDRFADVEMVLCALELNFDVLSVGDADGRARLRTGVGPADDALVVDDRGLDDDLAQHVARLQKTMVVGRLLAGLDGAPQV